MIDRYWNINRSWVFIEVSFISSTTCRGPNIHSNPLINAASGLWLRTYSKDMEYCVKNWKYINPKIILVNVNIVANHELLVTFTRLNNSIIFWFIHFQYFTGIPCPSNKFAIIGDKRLWIYLHPGPNSLLSIYRRNKNPREGVSF